MESKQNKKRFITLQEARRRSQIRRIVYIPRINKINFSIGSLFVVLGVATIIIPSGSVFLIVAGVSLALCPVPINKLIIGLYDDVLFKLRCWL